MQKRILEEAPSRVPCRSFLTPFFDTAKENTSEHRGAGYLYTRRSENPSEKSEKTLVQGSLLGKEHRDRIKESASV